MCDIPLVASMLFIVYFLYKILKKLNLKHTKPQMNNSGLAFQISPRRPQSLLKALLKYETDVSYFEQTNSMLNQTPTALYELMKHKPIHLLKHKATGYGGIKPVNANGHEMFCYYSHKHNFFFFVANRIPPWRLKFPGRF